MIITLVFEKNANFYCRILSKIAENCDHHIDPWNGDFCSYNIDSSLFLMPTMLHLKLPELFLALPVATHIIRCDNT
jgi:hypothetical protein